MEWRTKVRVGGIRADLENTIALVENIALEADKWQAMCKKLAGAISVIKKTCFQSVNEKGEHLIGIYPKHYHELLKSEAAYRAMREGKGA